MRVDPPAPRYQLEPLPAGVRVSIPAPRKWFAVLFLPIWLGMWSIGEIKVAGTLAGFLRNPSLLTRDPSQLFLIFWFVMWTIAGAFAVATVLWLIIGREELRIDSGTLTLRAGIGPIGRTREFDLSQVRRLRVTPVPPYPYRQANFLPPFFGAGQGPVTFDYGARTYRAGAGLDEAEANALVKELTANLPKSALVTI